MEASKPPGIGKQSWQIGQWEQRSVQSQGDRLVGAGIVRRITNSPITKKIPLQQQEHCHLFPEKELARKYKQQSLKAQSDICLLLEINTLHLIEVLPVFGARDVTAHLCADIFNFSHLFCPRLFFL